MHSFLKKYTVLVSLAAALLCTAANAQTQTEQPAPAPGWWDQTKAKATEIVYDGDLSLLLAGYSYHGRNTYTAERIAELNEKTWGLGFYKSIRNAKDNEEALYAMLISDSHFRPQPMVGYVYQWMKPLSEQIEVGLGFTATLASRTDYVAGFPLPGILPVASLGSKNNKLMASYVPRLSKNKGNGDVLFLFARFELK